MSCLAVLIFGFKLQRICCNEKLRDGERASKVESSLKHSKNQSLKRLVTEDQVNIDDAVANIMKIKSVSPELHPQFGPSLKTCLCQICGYTQLVADVENVRKTKYSSEDKDHELQLLQLWQRLKPDTPLDKRISKQWTEIGFQGDDPATDFRGMGLLGLQNLLYFVSQHTDTARQILSHSDHPQHGFSFAIVGINLTGLVHQLLISGALKTHFYNLVQGRPRLEHFHQVYCIIFQEFDKFWFMEKPNIMQFNQVKERFHKKLVQQLKNRNCTLKGNLSGDRL